MSGGGTTSVTGEGGRFPDCDIRFETNIASPDPAVVRKLTARDVLEVVLVKSAVPTGTRVELRTIAGDVAGGIAHPNIGPLIRCIEEGHVFVADVIEVTHGTGRVSIRPE